MKKKKGKKRKEKKRNMKLENNLQGLEVLLQVSGFLLGVGSFFYKLISEF